MVFIAEKGTKAGAAQKVEEPKVSDSPACTSALNAAKLSIRQMHFHVQKDMDKMMQQGAEISLEEMRNAADRHGIRWWRNEAAFDKAVFKMWESLRHSGDMGNVEFTEDGKVEVDGDYLEGAREGVEILRRVLSKGWEERKEKEQQLKPLAQDVKRGPIITPPPAKAALYSDRVEETRKNAAPETTKPADLPDPAQKHGVKWLAEKEREEKAKKKADDERAEGHTGGGNRHEE